MDGNIREYNVSSRSMVIVVVVENFEFWNFCVGFVL